MFSFINAIRSPELSYFDKVSGVFREAWKSGFSEDKKIMQAGPPPVPPVPPASNKAPEENPAGP